jgi:hypothetical protein
MVESDLESKGEHDHPESKVNQISVTPYLRVPASLAAIYRKTLLDTKREADEKQPPKPGEFTQRAAAIHEASHCVVAHVEGKKTKYAAIWRKDGNWFGEHWLAEKSQLIDTKEEPEKALASLRITLAGRRGELLFEPEFCLRAGLDELVFAQLMIIAVSKGMGNDPSDVWGTTLLEIDDTLSKYEPIVRRIADKLITLDKVDRWQLARALSSVEARKSEPPICKGAVPGPPLDPLT